ncbi:hypothetical protein UFOVP1247_92 [uncultured Caudovirales phage]|uniref:Uncharacterized protein n=1 Tax=uncultured Caudovirales phage TaxID=2100421 RepID=A0A6J5PYK2_9CAUD|nr:hypothetical protein UFOVP970_132 [uncultured Caudovirales phage]CAB4193523.1 hypothetical protein UFOVP1247_92 [uncultured Caudovirales phage]
MKNLHVIATDKPSRIKQEYTDKPSYVLSRLPLTCRYAQHIYITNGEEIKKDEFYLGDDNHIYCLCTTVNSNGKKIILTTNEELIDEGIQPIGDEFLNWFVNNPTCEEVEVENSSVVKEHIFDGSNDGEVIWEYKIIIPKEEPKQIYYNTVGRENGVFVIKGQFNTQKEALDLANELNEKGLGVYYDWNETLVKEEPKQERERGITITHVGKPKQETVEEFIGYGYDPNAPGDPDKIDDLIEQKTLEEAAQKYLNNGKPQNAYSSFIDGANYQAERMYSEAIEFGKWLDENMQHREYYPMSAMTMEELFEQFKKG